ncbi:MAG: carboxypeptidase-like regulatory domain-containing protein [Acidobacteriaceae bacterium]
MKQLVVAAAAIAALAIPHAFAQTACQGTALNGSVRDVTQALVPGAAVTLDGRRRVVSNSDGRFEFACVSDGRHKLTATANGFARTDEMVSAPHEDDVRVILKLKDVETQVDVTGGGGAATDAEAAGPSQTISGDRLQSLADDPDDLKRELQQLAAAAGGNPANATIAVDGFQGSSALPPKSSIAYIEVNPDQFSAQYREPPFSGGRVEVYTKPGQKTYHGAVFATNGSSWMNARDPFSVSSAPLGKQRYGFELTGPIRRKGSDFSLALEHRSIDNYAVVNAVTLNSAGDEVATVENVPAPQRLWLGTARLDWQLGMKNTFIATYSANVNHLQNVTVGGATLQEAGYDSGTYEHMFRLSDITTVSTHLMHEARASFRFDGETDVPNSATAQVSVAGAFTGGGATIGQQRLKEFNLEADDDAILTTKHHTMKFGTQFMLYDEHQQLTTNFNGTYTFGGGAAPVLDANNQPVAGETETITGVEQYRRALLGLAGGSPTAFANVAGTPVVDFNMVTNALFFQDDWEVGRGVHVAYGVRYYMGTDPTILNAAVPRLGILWSPGKKHSWTLHAHAGLFSGQFPESDAAEILREDGTERVTSTIYNPVCGGAAGAAFSPTTCNPFTDATPIHSKREYAPHFGDLTWAAENIGGTKKLPAGFNLSLDYYVGRIWNYMRSENINSPLNDEPTGPRPGPADLNILQVQNSGQGSVNATFAGIENHKYKRAQFFFGGVRVNLIDDTDDNEFFTPQSSTSNVGEYAHRTGQPEWNVFGNGTFTLPEKIVVSTNVQGGGGSHYNVTTGFDNNGDGDFNDRPQYALPGTPSCATNPSASPCSYATQWGNLVASGGTGVFPRNKGVQPWTIYLDANVERVFKLTRNAKANHPQTLTLNVRSSNVLNHLNVTQIGGVLGSPEFGVPYAADNGRRVEAGVRYSF